MHQKKADDKIYICKLSMNVLTKLYHIQNYKILMINSVDLDEVAHIDLDEVAHIEPPR